MKIILILNLFALIFSANIYAQSFKPVLQTDSVSWDIANAELYGIEMGKLVAQNNKDTAELYKQMYGVEFDYIGKLWEDTTKGKLWYQGGPYYSDEKVLIMDMTLNVGDTFEIHPLYKPEVDSVYYLNGRKVIKFDQNTNYWGEKVKFIEGVGPNTSVAYRFVSDYDVFYASCKYHNEELVYVNNNDEIFDGCMPDDTGIDLPSKNNQINLYPNPTSGDLHIELSKTLSPDYEIFIFDIYGKVAKHKKLSGYKHVVDLNKLNINKGVYFVKIKTTKGFIARLRIIHM